MADQNQEVDRNTQNGTAPWSFRRRWTVITLMFSFGLMAFAVYRGADMANAVLPHMSLIVIGVMAAYGGFAVAEDINRGRS